MPLILGGNLAVIIEGLDAIIIITLLHKLFSKLLRNTRGLLYIELYNHGTNTDLAIKYNDFM